MYLEIDEGFPGHRKTLRLCSLMSDPKAGWHMVHFWTWACRSCKDGNLRGLGAFEIEEAARYQAHDGKLCAAMIDSGYIDADDAGKPAKIHNWMKRTGAAIKKMECEADRKKLYRAHREKKCGTSCEWCAKERGESADGPRTVVKTSSGQTDTVQTRPVQSRQDKREDPEEEGGKAPPVVSGHIRPRTAHDLEHCLRIAVQREQQTIWNPGGSFAAKEAREFLEGFGDDLESALATIEARIELFAKDATMSPWTIAKFAKAYNGIGVKKALGARADAKPSRMQARY